MGRKLSRSNVAKKAWATRRKNSGLAPVASKEEVAISYQTPMMALEDAINQLIIRIGEQTNRIRNML